MTKYLPVFTIGLFLLTQACKKGNDGPAGPQGPKGLAYYGVIAGHIAQYDQYGLPLVRNLDGVKVSLNDSTSTITDTNGYYTFDSVATGNYTITASKNGLGTVVAANTLFVKDTFFKNIKMSLKPDFDILSFNAYHTAGSGKDSLTATFAASSASRNCIVFAGRTPGVNTYNYSLAYIKALGSGNLLTVLVPSSDLSNAGFASGETVYYSISSYVVGDASVYEDPVSGTTVYPSTGNPLTDSTTAP